MNKNVNSLGTTAPISTPEPITKVEVIRHYSNRFIKFEYTNSGIVRVYHINAKRINAIYMIKDSKGRLISVNINTPGQSFEFKPLSLNSGTIHVELKDTYDWLVNVVILDQDLPHSTPAQFGTMNSQVLEGLSLEKPTPEPEDPTGSDNKE